MQSAKKVLDNGTPEVCEAVERGELSVHAAATMIPRKERTKATTKHKGNGRRRGHQKQYAALWRQLRDGLEKLNGMPDSEFMANKVVPAAQRDLVSRRLPSVLDWLQSFNQAWEGKRR